MSADREEAGWGLDDAVVRALGAGDGTRLRVLRGQPDEVELAALVAGIAAHRAATAAGGGATAGGRWTDQRRRLGLPPVPGADAWRWSAR